MEVLYHFQRTTIISLLPDVLLYALPYNIFAYHFQRVSMRSRQVF